MPFSSHCCIHFLQTPGRLIVVALEGPVGAPRAFRHFFLMDLRLGWLMRYQRTVAWC
jgi:hypothetical protein